MQRKFIHICEEETPVSLCTGSPSKYLFRRNLCQSVQRQPPGSLCQEAPVSLCGGIHCLLMQGPRSAVASETKADEQQQMFNAEPQWQLLTSRATFVINDGIFSKIRSKYVFAQIFSSARLSAPWLPPPSPELSQPAPLQRLGGPLEGSLLPL